MALSLHISDANHLLALSKALFEAKFSEHPFSPELAGSPFVADVVDQVTEMLDAESIGSPSRLPASDHAREWEIALDRAAESSKWPEWNRDSKEEFSRILLTPLRTMPDDIAQFIAAVDARWERADEAPESSGLHVVAVGREYDLSIPGEVDSGVLMFVGFPHPVPDRSRFYCRFQITGLSSGSKVRVAYGVDGIEALALALQAAKSVVESSLEFREGRLRLPTRQGAS